MKLTIKKKISIKKLNKFVNAIDGKIFNNNKNLKNPPWKYLNLKKFKFYYLISKNNVIGSMVILNTTYSNHLSFFYILNKNRAKGLGSNFLKKVFIDNTSKKLKTVHVNKQLKRTIKFYKKHSFFISNKKKNKLIKKWVKRCILFDKNTFKDRHLMILK